MGGEGVAEAVGGEGVAEAMGGEGVTVAVDGEEVMETVGRGTSLKLFDPSSSSFAMLSGC